MRKQAQIKITESGTDAEVVLGLSVEQLAELKKEAEERGISLADMFGEGIRLQRLLNQVKKSGGKKALYYRVGDTTRELESV